MVLSHDSAVIMVGVIIQPCRGKEARRHREISIDREIDFTGDNAINDMLITHFPRGRARFWGNTPGKRGYNLSMGVKHITTGDYVLWTASYRAFSVGRVVIPFTSSSFADATWGRSETNDGQSYMHVYAVTDVRPIDMTYDEILNALGVIHTPKSVFRGVRRFSHHKSQALIRLIDNKIDDSYFFSCFSTINQSRSPLMRLASCISLVMIVTRLAWSAHRFVSSNSPTR
jgi:hypothetical protein